MASLPPAEIFITVIDRLLLLLSMISFSKSNSHSIQINISKYTVIFYLILEKKQLDV